MEDSSGVDREARAERHVVRVSEKIWMSAKRYARASTAASAK